MLHEKTSKNHRRLKAREERLIRCHFRLYFHDQSNLAADSICVTRQEGFSFRRPCKFVSFLSFSLPSWVHAKFFFPVSLFIYSVGERFVLWCSCRMWGGGRGHQEKEESVLYDQGSELPSQPKGPSSKGCLRICEGKAKARLNISDGALFGWLMKRSGMFIPGRSGHFTKFIESGGICSSQLNVTSTSRLLSNPLGS